MYRVSGDLVRVLARENHDRERRLPDRDRVFQHHRRDHCRHLKRRDFSTRRFSSKEPAVKSSQQPVLFSVVKSLQNTLLLRGAAHGDGVLQHHRRNHRRHLKRRVFSMLSGHDSFLYSKEMVFCVVER